MSIIKGLEITIIGMKGTQLIKRMREGKSWRGITMQVVVTVNKWARYKGGG